MSPLLGETESLGDDPVRGGVDVTVPVIARRALRTPRSATVAGIAFSVLLTVAVLVVLLEIPTTPGEAGSWLSDSTRRSLVLVALSLVPFAGIAFIWFIGVVRDRVSDAEDRFFATVFLGSGLLFTAMLFASTDTATAVVASGGNHASVLVSSGLWNLAYDLSHAFLNIAMRMAAVFTIAGSTILRRTDTGPRWPAVMGIPRRRGDAGGDQLLGLAGVSLPVVGVRSQPSHPRRRLQPADAG